MFVTPPIAEIRELFGMPPEANAIHITVLQNGQWVGEGEGFTVHGRTDPIKFCAFLGFTPSLTGSVEIELGAGVARVTPHLYVSEGVKGDWLKYLGEVLGR